MSWLPLQLCGVQGLQIHRLGKACLPRIETRLAHVPGPSRSSLTFQHCSLVKESGFASCSARHIQAHLDEAACRKPWKGTVIRLLAGVVNSRWDPPAPPRRTATDAALEATWKPAHHSSPPWVKLSTGRPVKSTQSG